MSNKIAVLMTCHNRKQVTLACLERVRYLQPHAEVYCVDDASNDGTAEAIKEKFPKVHVIAGNGHLFWCRGMNLAWKTAKREYDYDFYIWLNDDLLLYDHAFEELMSCCHENDDYAIISGLVQGEKTKKAVYGGYDDKHKIIEPTGAMRPIGNLNGNFVAVPQKVFKEIGFFDDYYIHDIGDVDYGLMGQGRGIPVLTTKSFIGSTDEGLKTKSHRIRKEGVGLVARFKRLYSPLGCPPHIHYHFFVKNYGYLKAIAYVCYLFFINLLPDPLFNLIFKRYNG